MGMSKLVAAFVSLIVVAAATPASASIRVGTLVCDIEAGAGFILGSRKALSCDFNNFFGPNSYYDGSITKIGVDAGLTAGTRVIWAVFAPTTQKTPGALEGRYYGVTAEVTAAVGVGANLLVGGFDRSINLQPLSVQGQVGANIAAGIAALRLKSPPPIVRKR